MRKTTRPCNRAQTLDTGNNPGVYSCAPESRPLTRTSPCEAFGCRPATIERLGMGRRTETAHARTRGGVYTVYGDLRVLRSWRRRDHDSDLRLSRAAGCLGSIFMTSAGQCLSEKHSEVMVIGTAVAGAGAQLPDGRSGRASPRCRGLGRRVMTPSAWMTSTRLVGRGPEQRRRRSR